VKTKDTITVKPMNGVRGIYFAVSVGYAPMGTVEKRSDGYLPQGRRKTVATLEEAALETVWTRVRHSLKDAADWSRLVNDRKLDLSPCDLLSASPVDEKAQL
jgi:hypothetical protein